MEKIVVIGLFSSVMLLLFAVILASPKMKTLEIMFKKENSSCVLNIKRLESNIDSLKVDDLYTDFKMTNNKKLVELSIHEVNIFLSMYSIQNESFI